jgi:ribose-phosphate pyrophosphokinase
MHMPDPVVVSPDAGGVRRANSFRERMGASLAIISKQRPEPDVAEVLEMVGEVEGKTAIIVDDMISTGKTLVEAAHILMARGARGVYACATHGALSADASDVIANSHLLETIITDTIPQHPETFHAPLKIISVAPLFAEAIMRIHKDLSLSALFA